MKTGECYFLDEENCLWLAVSFKNELDLVWTEFFKVEEQGII